MARLDGKEHSRDTYRLSFWGSSIGLVAAILVAAFAAFAPGLDGNERGALLVGMAFAAPFAFAVNRHARKKLR